MSKQLVIATAGAVIGFVASGFNPVGAQVGWSPGSMLSEEKEPEQADEHTERLD